MDGFRAVPGHVGFLAKQVYGQGGAVIDASIARLEPHGGGPAPAHSHPGRDHLFIAVEGVMEARTPAGARRFGPNEALLVKGGEIHEIWNAGDSPAVVVGVTLRPEG